MNNQTNDREDLLSRLDYESCLAKCAQSLLKSGRNAEIRVLQYIESLTGISRVYVFQNFQDPKDGLCMRQTHEVCGPEAEPQIDNPVLQHVVFAEGFSRWRDELSQGRTISGLIEDFPASEREILEPQDILSILVIPIFVDESWWGFIGFDDTRKQRKWGQKDISLLRAASEMLSSHIARSEAEEKVTKLLEEKELLLREVHHRIKNDLAFIHSFLSIQESQTENEDVRQALQVTGSRIASIGTIYDHLTHAEDLRCVSLKTMVESLTARVWRNTGRVNVEILLEIEDIELPRKLAVSCGIILNELVTNAKKYAFSESNEKGTSAGGRNRIEVRCKLPQEHLLILSVSDNGRGIEDAHAAEKAGGLGLTMVRSMARQYEGTLQILSNKGTAARVELKLP